LHRGHWTDRIPNGGPGGSFGRTATIRTLGANSAPRASHPNAFRFFAEAITAEMTPQRSQKVMRPPVISIANQDAGCIIVPLAVGSTPLLQLHESQPQCS